MKELEHLNKIVELKNLLDACRQVIERQRKEIQALRCLIDEENLITEEVDPFKGF